MRRGVVLVLLVAAAAPTQARADEVVRAEPSNRYANPEVTIDPGEAVTFRNNDIVRHDVTSEQKRADGKRLFVSELTSGGKSAPVEGAADLQPGVYAFFCSIHSQMKGTLTVNGTAGPLPTATATPTPTPTPRPDTTAPEVTLSGTLRARPIRRSKRVLLTLRSNEIANVVLRAKIGARKIGVRRLRVTAGEREIAIRIRKPRAVQSGKKLRIVVVAADRLGNRRRSELVVRLP